MRILPVIDLKDGHVVRAIAGQRAAYRPLNSMLAADSAPAVIAAALTARFGFAEAYVADLDAIGGAPPDTCSYAALQAAGLKLWLDAGLSSLALADDIAPYAHTLIAGLESLPSPVLLSELLARFGPERLALSLDMKAGVPLVRAWQWRGKSPLEIAADAVACGVRRAIVLDLAAVGVAQGPAILPVLASLHREYPTLQWCAGGGVRHLADLQALQLAGASTALVASALHDGGLSPADCQWIKGRCAAGRGPT